MIKKLSLKWFRNRYVAASAVTVALAFSQSPLQADTNPVGDTELAAVGIAITFTDAVVDATTGKTTTEAEAKASITDSGLAKDLGVPDGDDQVLTWVEGPFTNLTSINQFKALLAQAKANGVVSLAFSNGTTFDIPLKKTAEEEAARYGLVFAGSGTVTVSSVQGVAAQTGIRIGEEVEAINGTKPENALHAAALFFNAIDSNGRATITIDGKPYQVPQNPIVTGLGRGVAASGPHVPFPQFLDRGDDPVADSGNRSSSNEVIAARVETYYFRDAHRLAQILNRGVKSYQAAAVSLLERAAQDAGESFEVAKSRRRELEFNASEKAKELRQKKKELATVAAALRQQLNPGPNSGPNGPTTLSDYHASLDDLTKRRTSTTSEMQDLQNGRVALLDEQRRIRAEQATMPPPNAARRAELADALTLSQTRLATTNDQITDLGQQIAFLDNQIATLGTLIKSFVPPTASTPATPPPTVGTLNNLVADVQRLEVEVSEATLKAQQANDAEQLAAKNQFRAEVAAAKADPDTYVPGKLNSVDPVTQVSISVIGEGVLHLRGPRLGVVKIREMINQLDHPVGQVRLGIMTVQLNGESGARMENTMRRMEGHLSRGRFLTYVSQELFKRAVVEVSSRVAATPSIDSGYLLAPGSLEFAASQVRNRIAPETFGKESTADWLKSLSVEEAKSITELTEDQKNRWNRYAAAFFGEDFIKGLQDVNQEFPTLNPVNKLLSLSSVDSLTITEALFVTALAKGTVRQQILQRFRYYLQNDLPQKDYHWVTVNKIKKGWNPLWWGEDCTSQEAIKQHTREFYTFDATSTFLDRDYAGNDPFCSDGRILDQYG